MSLQGRETRPGAQMPQMPLLIRVAFLACLPIAIGACFLTKLGFALGVAFGFGTCVLLYTFLRSYVVRVTTTGKSPGTKSQFLAMFLGKFVVVAIVLYLLLDVLKGNIAGFLTGFVISQIAITVVGYKHLEGM